MCDYSLMHVKSRPASVGDKLRTTNFGTGTRGFAAPSDPGTAVCVLPGTELAFSSEIAVYGACGPTHYKTAIFRQVNREQPHMHHDALELPDGQMLLLTFLCEGQEATVLQLPAKPAMLRWSSSVGIMRMVEFDSQGFGCIGELWPCPPSTMFVADRLGCCDRYEKRAPDARRCS